MIFGMKRVNTSHYDRSESDGYKFNQDWIDWFIDAPHDLFICNNNKYHQLLIIFSV